MAFGAVVPLPAARRADGDLRVQDMFAGMAVRVLVGSRGSTRVVAYHMLIV
jgi:hypothetical protein